MTESAVDTMARERWSTKRLRVFRRVARTGQVRLRVFGHATTDISQPQIKSIRDFATWSTDLAGDKAVSIRRSPCGLHFLLTDTVPFGRSSLTTTFNDQDRAPRAKIHSRPDGCYEYVQWPYRTTRLQAQLHPRKAVHRRHTLFSGEIAKTSASSCD